MSNSTISWKSDPDYRGTFSILTTCLSTLFICVWSAVHDDVPKGKRRIDVLLRRIGWLVLGLIAPEVLLYISYHQYTVAKKILRDAEQAFKMKSPPSSWCARVQRRWLKLFKVSTFDPWCVWTCLDASALRLLWATHQTRNASYLSYKIPLASPPPLRPQKRHLKKAYTSGNTHGRLPTHTGRSWVGSSLTKQITKGNTICPIGKAMH